MTKISFDLEAEEVEITRTIRKTGEGRIKINREGGGEIEINIGIAKIGGTTDYGGAITLGVFGQEVTWGREGGTIHLGIGGFNVDVEARDCIVTEIKSIHGNIVAQRSYPDPGCKLPDPPIPTPTPTPEPNPGGGIDLPDSDEVGWVVFNMERKFYDGPVLEFTGMTIREASEIQLENKIASRLPFKLVSRNNPGGARDYTINKNTSIHIAQTYHTLYNESGTSGLTAQCAQPFPINTYFWWYVAGFFGKVGDIKKFIDLAASNNDALIARLPALNSSASGGFHTGGLDFYYFIPVQFIPLKSAPQKPKPFLPTGNKPPMRDCCEEVLEYLSDFEEAFEIRRLLEEKFPISNSFMAPECDPTAVTEAKTYYEISQCLIRILAHGLIFEPRVNIKDADAAKAGDQEFKAKYVNATGWASAIAEALLEVKDDGNVSTNMDIRNAFAVTQTMVGLADANYKLEAIIDCFGIEVIPKVQTVDTPFNLQIQIGKGFGENNERQINLNTDEATEKLLPVLLQTKKNKIKTIEIHPRSRSLLEVLENIEANMPGINSNSG
jgi:hypothetical protein